LRLLLPDSAGMAMTMVDDSGLCRSIWTLPHPVQPVQWYSVPPSLAVPLRCKRDQGGIFPDVVPWRSGEQRQIAVGEGGRPRNQVSSLCMHFMSKKVPFGDMGSGTTGAPMCPSPASVSSGHGDHFKETGRDRNGEL
jgi:hypothetical protein